MLVPRFLPILLSRGLTKSQHHKPPPVTASTLELILLSTNASGVRILWFSPSRNTIFLLRFLLPARPRTTTNPPSLVASDPPLLSSYAVAELLPTDP